MGTRDNRNATPGPRRRFSDRLEYRRGQLDARAGRPPASMQPQYLSGYADGRRQARAARLEGGSRDEPGSRPQQTTG